MSHVHGWPLGTAPIMYCGNPSLGEKKQLAVDFDALLVQWAMSLAVEGDTVKPGELLFKQAATNVTEAKACGWSGFCAMQSLLETVEENGRQKAIRDSLKPWLGKIHGYYAPTYFGIMVVSVLLEP